MSRRGDRLKRLEARFSGVAHSRDAEIIAAELVAAGFDAVAWQSDVPGVTLHTDADTDDQTVARRNALLADFKRRGMGAVTIACVETLSIHLGKETATVDLRLMPAREVSLGAFVSSGQKRLVPPRGGDR